MISLSSRNRYFLYLPPTDIRKSFNGLGGIVRRELNGNLLSGDVFIFINRRRTRVKLLMWDQTGFVIFYKRLEEGTFELPRHKPELTGMEIRREDLMMILDGIELWSIRRRKRYSHSIPAG